MEGGGGGGRSPNYSVESTRNRIHQESGRTAFIISSWPLLNGGNIVLKTTLPLALRWMKFMPYISFDSMCIKYISTRAQESVEKLQKVGPANRICPVKWLLSCLTSFFALNKTIKLFLLCHKLLLRKLARIGLICSGYQTQ